MLTTLEVLQVKNQSRFFAAKHIFRPGCNFRIRFIFRSYPGPRPLTKTLNLTMETNSVDYRPSIDNEIPTQFTG